MHGFCPSLRSVFGGFRVIPLPPFCSLYPSASQASPVEISEKSDSLARFDGKSPASRHMPAVVHLITASGYYELIVLFTQNQIRA